jgi:hypothetical protein
MNEVKIKRAVSVIEMDGFNQERVMDILGFDLKILKVEIETNFHQHS